MSLRIVVADDEAYVVLAIEEVLKELGAVVFGAHDGEAALRLVKAEHPDLVLLDVRMPKLDGFQVAEAMRQNASTAGIPVMFFSAHGTTDDKVRGLDLAEDYIAKPVDANELKARVRKILRRRAPVDAGARGSLRGGTLVSLLRRSAMERISGRLLLTQQGERGAIEFAGGEVVRAVQGPRRGESAVYQLLTWHEGTFELGAAGGPSSGGEVAASFDALLDEGLRRLDELPGLRDRLRTARGPLDIFDAVREAIQGSVSPAAASLLDLFDGTRDLERILAASPFDAWETLRILGALLGSGALTFSGGSERRSGLRFKVGLPMEYQGRGLWQESATFNLSSWGVFIRTAVPLDAQEQVQLRFRLPGWASPLTAVGRVVWSNPDPSRWGGMGMGIQFVELAEANREAIDWCLAQMVAAELCEVIERQSS